MPAIAPQRLSIIVPVLNEASGIVAAMENLQGFRVAGTEVIVVDGSSDDETIHLASPLADQIVLAPRGRARQMNLGAAMATGDVFLFVHADTRLPAQADRLVMAKLAQGYDWGRFDVNIEGASRLFPIIAGLMNLRSRITGIATGDQAIFVRRSTFEEAGGFPPIPLMEDISFSAHMCRHGRPGCVPEKLTTSGRRWEKHGVLQTILKMWWMRLRFYFGANPKKLAMEYGYEQH